MEKGRQVRSHISHDFVGIPQGEMKIFYMNAQVGQPSNVG